MAPTGEQSSSSSVPAQARRRRKRRLLSIVALLALALVVGGVLLINKTGVVGSVVLSRLESMLGCEATATEVSITLDGRVIVRGLELRAPGIDGPGGLILQAPEITAEPEWLSLLGSSPRVERLELRQPVFRLAQDETLALNVQRLTPTSGPGGGLAPSVDVIDGTLEFGEYGDGWYTGLQAIRVHGKLARIAPGSSSYTIQLIENRSPSREGERLELTGEFDLRRMEGSLQLGSVSLQRFAAGGAPSRVEPLWRQLALSGSVRGAEFSYSRAAGVAATLSLDNVDMNIPIPADESPEEDDEPEPLPPFRSAVSSELVRMRGVNGTIRFTEAGLQAELAGAIEDLPCQVELETQGLSLDAALVCRIRAENFRVADQPRLLPFAPRVVKRNFLRFSGPTALINGEVEIRRPAGGSEGSGRLSAAGFISFTEGTARFDKFPYPFRDVSGVLRFDEEKVTIEDVTGVGLTGARLTASGIVAPPVSGAAVDIRVLAAGVPADATLYESIPENRRDIYDAVFSRTEYEELERKGVFLSPQSQAQASARRAELQRMREQAGARGLPEELATELAQLDERLRAPVFGLAGECDVRVHVRRDLGGEDFDTTVEVTLSEAGLLPEAFPYPVIAQDFRLVITDAGAVAEAPVMRGLTGAGGRMRTDVEFLKAEHDTFVIRVNAQQVGLDNVLLAALERRDERSRLERPHGAALPGIGDSAASLLRSLGVSGEATCDAKIRSNGAGGVSYAVGVGFAGVEARPGGADLLISDLRGSMELTDGSLRLRDLRGRIGDAVVTADLGATGLDRGAEPARLAAGVEFTGLDLQQPIERLIESLSPAHAAPMRALRQERRPTGRVDASVGLGVTAEGVEYEIELSRPRDVSFSALDGRIAILDSAGSLTVTRGTVQCQDFQALLAYADTPAGQVTLNGAWALFEEDAPASPERELTIELARGQLASPVVRAFAVAIAPQAAAWLNELEIGGAFEASGVAVSGAGREPSFTGSIRPRSIILTREGHTTTFHEVTGSISFGPGGGRLEEVRAVADDWSLDVSGTWDRTPSLDCALSVQAQGLPDGLRALLPDDARRSFAATELEVGGPLSISDARMRLAPLPPDGALGVSVSMTALADDVRANVGLPLSAPHARAVLNLRPTAREGAPALELDLAAPLLATGEFDLAWAEGRLRSGDRPAVLVLDHVRALAHEGHVSVTGSMRLGDEQEPGSYELEAQASGVDFARLLADLSNPTRTTLPEPADVDASRGTMDAYIGLAGRFGDPSSRRGTGVIRVLGGEVIALPGLTGLLRLSNLQPPLGETLDAAVARFHIRGDTVHFESIEATSNSLAIVGEGEMEWPSTELKLRFNTRGASRIPILSDLFRGLRDEIVSTEMTGTLRNLRSELIQLPATRRMLGTIFRGAPRVQPPQASPARASAPVGGQESSRE